MEDGHDLRKPGAVDRAQLCRYPLELHPVLGDVGIEDDKEERAVAKRIRGIARQPLSRSLWRPQLRHGGSRTGQSEPPPRIAQVRGRRDVVVPDRKPIGNAAARDEALDHRDEADIPLLAESSVRYGVAGLHDEGDRYSQGTLSCDDVQHRVNDVAVLRLQRLAIRGSSRVAIHEEGEPAGGGRGHHVLTERGARIDRAHNIADG